MSIRVKIRHGVVGGMVATLALIGGLSAQNIYRLSYGVDVTLASTGLATFVPAYFIKKNKPLLTEVQIASLNRDDVWKVDRFATRYWNPHAATASDILMISSLTLPSTLLVSQQVRKEAGVVVVMYAETWLLTAGITSLTKELTRRKRPFVYSPQAPIQKKLEPDATSSFFSGHTSFSAASSFFLAKIYADLYPASKWKPYMWAGAAVLPLATGALRVVAGKHYLTDVLIGYLTGAAIGTLTPHLHKNNKGRLFP